MKPRGMSRVLVVGPSSFETCDSIARAFRRLGWVAETAMFDMGQSRSRYWIRRIARYSGNLAGFERAVFNRFLRVAAIPRIVSDRPDLVLFVKPYEVTAENLQALRASGVRIVTWATDSLTRLEGQDALQAAADRRYVMDGGDAGERSAEWLPLGWDDEIFQPTDKPPEWDVLFVGNVFRRGYDTRAKFFDRLRSSSLGGRYRVGFVGSVPSRVANRLRRLPGSVRWVSTGLPFRRLARVIASSSICVNVHQDDGLEPVNPLFFAICGCRVCLVTDTRPYLDRWMVGGDAYVQATPDEVPWILEALLAAPERIESIAAVGCRAALGHTYVRRVERMLADGRMAAS